MNNTRSIDRTRMSRLVAAVASLSVMALLVMQTSNAAFTDNTENEANFFNAASISLVDNDDNDAMFEVEDMVPTQTEERCIQVEYSGSDTADVALFVGGMNNPDGFAEALNITVDHSVTDPAVGFLGTGDNQDFDCTLLGFDDTAIDDTYTDDDIATFAANSTDFGTGVLPTEFADNQVRTYRFTVDFEDDVAEIAGVTDLDELQTADVDGLTFTWEAQTTTN